jgi:BirA family biotin operon repressor/biotin-[acetyl-CoA-carboxylase] ligase
MKKNIKIGSSITFLDSVDSTNNYTAKLILEKKIENGQVIMADYQGQGRGQRGSSWHSERGKNVLVSVYLELDNLSVQNQSLLSKYAAVSIFESLKKIGLHPKIKWPNDILINDKKICGILIENQFLGQKIKSSIIGFGLNVNQEIFDLDKITSLKKELSVDQERMSILGIVINYFNQNLELLLTNSNYIEDIFLKNLYKINQQADFFNDKLGHFQGIITGIDSDGKIQITTDMGLFSFDIKELKYC